MEYEVCELGWGVEVGIEVVRWEVNRWRRVVPGLRGGEVCKSRIAFLSIGWS